MTPSPGGSGFDIDAARKAGYSDDQILEYLSKQNPAFDAAGAIKAGHGKSDIIKHLATRPLQFGASQGGARAETQNAELPIDWGAVLRHGAKALPELGAAMATFAAPEVGIPARAAYAMLGGSAGKAIDQAVEAMSGNAPASAQDALIDNAKEGLTQGVMQGGSELAMKPVGWLLGKTLGRLFKPDQLYQSAVMPAAGKARSEVEKIVQGGINEGIPASEAGYRMAGEKWRQLNQQVENVIGNDPDKPVDLNRALGGLQKLRQYWNRGSGDPEIINAIDAVERNFLDRHAPGAFGPGLPTLRGEEAQAAKKGLYDEIRLANQNAWTAGKPAGPNVEAKQEIAQGLMQELQQMYPDLKGLNQREGAMIGLERELGRFLNREGNKRITPYFATAGAGALAGSAMGGTEGASLGAAGLAAAHLVRSALEDPGVKSMIAIAMKKAANATPPGVKAVGAQIPKVINLPNAVRAARAMEQVSADQEPKQ